MVTPRLNFPISNINSRSLQPVRRSQVPGSRSRVPRGTDLSERPGAWDLARGSHRLGALGPPEPRSGRVRSTAMAPAGRKRQTAGGAAGQQRRGRLKTPPHPGPASYTEQTWTSGRRSPSATSKGSGFRCCLRHLRASLRRRRPADAAALPAPASRGKREGLGERCGRRSMRSTALWIVWNLDLLLFPGCISECIQRMYVPYPVSFCSSCAAIFLLSSLYGGEGREVKRCVQSQTTY